MKDNYLVLALYQLMFSIGYYVNIHNIVFYNKNKEEIKRRYWGKNKIDPSEYWGNLFVIALANIFILAVTFGWIGK